MGNQFPAVSGYNQIPNGYFVPEIWSGNMLKNFYEQAIASEICNHDYEGEIKDKGDKVIIRRDPEVEIRAYQKGKRLEMQNVSDDAIEFPIQRGVYFNFPVDDVDRRQSDVPWIQKVTNNASIKIKNYIDATLFADVYGHVATGNQFKNNVTLSASATDSTGIPSFLTSVMVMLDENHCPNDGGRFLIVTPAIKGLIMQNSVINNAMHMGDKQSMLRTGYLGTFDGLKIYVTTNLYAKSTYTYVLAGHTAAITFATQITKTEKLRNPNTFGDIIRGLQVFDWKVVQPTLLCYGTVKTS